MMLTDNDTRLIIGHELDRMGLIGGATLSALYPAPQNAPLIQSSPALTAEAEGPGFWQTIAQGLSGAWLNVSDGVRSFLSSADVQRGAGDVGSGIGRGIGDVGSGVGRGVGDVGSGVGRGVGDGVGGIGAGMGSGLKVGLAIGIPAVVVAGYFILKK